MQKEKLVPAIRFKGFEEEWNISKLCEAALKFDNLRVPVAESLRIKGVFPYYGANGVQDYVSGFTHNGEFVLIAEDGANDLDSYPSNYVNGKFWANNHVHVLQGIKGIIDNKFLNHSFKNIDFKPILTGGDRAKLTASALDTINIKVPIFDEQQKIGWFLSNLDSLIHSQELKVEKLQSMKQSLLDKMFIKNNQHMPNVRFNSYYENWYYANIQECSKVFIGLVTTMTTNYSKHGVLLIRNSDIKDGRFEFDENPIHLEWSFAMRNKSRMHMEGDVVTVHTGDVGTSAVVSEKEAKSIGFATIVTRPDKNKLDSSFLSVFLNTETHKKWAVQISTGDGRTNYNLGDYKLLNIPMTNLSEQQKIGQFFSNLDSLIHSQEQKLEKLNNIKQALLEKMFC
ncbi:restriction endonuclease subunit S [Mycoplasma sp. Z631]|uniref:restriction endonuclease subunit S n=1 Tax=Mycoplasma sp. Z631 TaxID=3401685 RepID=UPI003AAE46EC